MRLCWDTLNTLRYSKRSKKWYGINRRSAYVLIDACKYCGESFLARENPLDEYCSRSCSQHAKNHMIGKSREKHHNWRGGKTASFYRRKFMAEWINILKEQGIEMKCSKCGFSESFCAIDFHHRDTRKKEYNLSEKMHYKPTEQRVSSFLEELKKCDILCSNCHRMVHEELFLFKVTQKFIGD